MADNLFIVISHTNPDPMYKQVTDQIKNAITLGYLKPGDRLPSVRNLVQELNISTITVKRAYADLEMDGYILTRAGLGTFVSEIDKDQLRENKIQEIERELTKILLNARKYKISKDEIVTLIHKIEDRE